ncbi:acyltransferase [Vibrio diazotrophicus]|uniref:acyltransferase n=1 Tax=Vibrio diazotrophicus TaxID=685 RepID=UPI00142DC1DD|nr:acyltransferase [Vibrio diazotrophicus]NIY94308.1 acyltransferase [Vibrio diazotrophicus]
MFNTIKKKLKFFVRGYKRFFFTRLALRGVKGYRTIPIVNNRIIFNGNVLLGENCHFNGMIISGKGSVVIGSNFHSGPNCQILTQNHNIHGVELPYDETYICKDVNIGDNVWIGTNVIILPGATIGEGAVIQAGSVVVSDIPELAIAGGHPAKVFSYRDSKHYFSLKKNIGL